MKQPEILFIYIPGKNLNQIHTWSKEDSKVDCAVLSDNHSNMQRLPDDTSIFTAEAKAVDLALDFMSTCDTNNRFIIFSDSLSVLKAMDHTSLKNPPLQKILEKCHELLANKEIVPFFVWCLTEIGRAGEGDREPEPKKSIIVYNI